MSVYITGQRFGHTLPIHGIFFISVFYIINTEDIKTVKELTFYD